MTTGRKQGGASACATPRHARVAAGVEISCLNIRDTRRGRNGSAGILHSPVRSRVLVRQPWRLPGNQGALQQLLYNPLGRRSR